jgi:hypothetical protein
MKHADRDDLLVIGMGSTRSSNLCGSRRPGGVSTGMTPLYDEHGCSVA